MRQAGRMGWHAVSLHVAWNVVVVGSVDDLLQSAGKSLLAELGAGSWRCGGVWPVDAPVRCLGWLWQGRISTIAGCVRSFVVCTLGFLSFAFITAEGVVGGRGRTAGSGGIG